MINDCIKMFAAAFCVRSRLKIKVTPSEDTIEAAQFISLLSGRCEIGEYQGVALIKPLKKRPATSCVIMVPQAGRELFFLIAGMAAQLDIAVRFDNVTDGISDGELEHISRVTQGQLRYARKDGAIYIASMMYDENPLFDECEEPVFAAGLCLGGVLARADTLVNVPKNEKYDVVRYTLQVLYENGADIYKDHETGEPVIRSMLQSRLPEKKPVKKTVTETAE